MARSLLAAAEGLDGVAAALAERLGAARAPPGLRPEPFEPIEGASALAAVDGGSGLVLEGGGIAVGAVRAAALVWRSHARVHEEPAALELRVLDEALAAELAARLPGLPAPEGPAALLDRLRALREWERARGLAELLGEGDVLALDGPLAPRERPAALLAELAVACAGRGALLAGVWKSASEHVGGEPALLAAARAGRGLREPWAAPLPGSPGPTRAFAVRFAKGARVFKVEVRSTAEPEEVLGKLAPWTRDAAYPGYPYPLALAHNRCALDEALLEDLAHALRARAARRGVEPMAWEEVFGDFHEVLDRGL